MMDLTRHDMRELWIHTFNDSCEYVDNLFDSYGDSMLTASEYIDDTLVSSLVGIPYDFLLGGEKESRLHGVYLGGLATSDRYRSRGIMSRLLERICNRASHDGFDFVFLIPANSGLRDYYRNRNFVASFYRYEYCFIAGYDFIRHARCKSGDYDKCSIIDVDYIRDKISSNDMKYLERISDNISLLEHESICKNRRSDTYYISHTTHDFVTLIKERVISGDLLYISKSDNEIKCALFARIVGSELTVDKIIYIDEYYALFTLNHIAQVFSDKAIRVVSEKQLDDDNMRILSVYNIDSEAENSNMVDDTVSDSIGYTNTVPHSYGMLRMLNRNKIVNTLHLRDTNELSDLQLAEVLFRSHIEGLDYAEQAFGLPSVGMSMSLMME